MELEQMIREARLAAGWTEAEMAANSKGPVLHDGEEADNRANGYYGPRPLTRREMEESRIRAEVA